MASNYRVHRIGDGLYNGCYHDAYYQTHFHVILCTRFWRLVLAGFMFLLLVDRLAKSQKDMYNFLSW